MNQLITAGLSQGITTKITRIPDGLLNGVELSWVKWIRDYISRYGAPPTLERFEDDNKSFVRVEFSDPIDDIFDQTIARKRNIKFIEIVNAKQKELRAGEDPKPLVDSLSNLFKLSTNEFLTTRQNDRTSYFGERKTFLYGIPLLDESTGGIAYGDYVLVVGRPGSYKTTFAEWLITRAFLRGSKILYVSNENPAHEVQIKLDAFLCGFNPIKNRIGGWTKRDLDRLFALGYMASIMDGEIIVPSEPILNVTDLSALISEHKPDIVFIDGIYLMGTGSHKGGWEEAASVSRDLKRLARAKSLPILGTIQANRGAEGQVVARDTIAFTDAYLQDADTIISMNMISGRCLGGVTKSRWGATPIGKTFELMVDFEEMTISTIDSVSMAINEEDW
jgi:hypothetical protein